MSIKFTPDKEVKIHEENAIRLICSAFRSHEAGIPEWVKNSADAYARVNAPSEQRIILVIFQQKSRQKPASIACLDFVGMTTSDIEKRFRNWADPDAAATDIINNASGFFDIQGGHGNGGKCYMTQMFDEYALIYTVRNGKGNQYGFKAGSTIPGYFPDPDEGRNFDVSNKEAELKKALEEIGVKLENLPESALNTLSQRDGVTLVKGVRPKDVLGGKIPVRSLIDSIRDHPQMIATVQICQVFIIVDGSLYGNGEPIRLAEIDPLPDAKDPKIIDIPETIIDPISEEIVSTIDEIYPAKGTLILKTSAKSMRWGLKYRHCIWYRAKSKTIGSIEIPELVRSYYGERIYGECHLDKLEKYKLNERKNLADSPLTRAIKEWLRKQIEAYANEFVKLDRLKASQEQKEELSRINSVLNEWKNQFLKELGIGVSGDGTGTGERPDKREKLPAISPSKIKLIVPFKQAGVNVSFKPKLEFFDIDGKRVRPVPYRWYSSDWNVATVDDELLTITTHAHGETEIWAETIAKGLKSNKVTLQVVDIKSVRLDPADIQIPAGQRRIVKAIAVLRDGSESDQVYLIWEENNRSVAIVSSIGMVYAISPGKTEIIAGDDNCTASIGAVVEVLPAIGRGGGVGSSYPQILLSEIDDDPLHPGQPRIFAPEEGPVCQKPEDVEANVWWINTSCPLARLYLDDSHEYGFKSREWRAYHLERYIEALVKIKLNHSFVLGEELSFDIMEQRWREEASEIQLKVVQDLEKFLDEGELPHGE